MRKEDRLNLMCEMNSAGEFISHVVSRDIYPVRPSNISPCPRGSGETKDTISLSNLTVIPIPTPV